ncbi:MAG: pyridoxamine kinase [Desulfovibrionaceae bacterium]|nr:pyridoxamine kinase [Desulfovibrionaceae bacterium]
MSSYPIDRVCAIHDLSGFGRASLTLVIPILATMGFQVCPLPTAVLSSQTSGMTDFSFCDLTEQMQLFLQHWQKLGLQFASIYSGFLGNPKQIDLAARCIHDFLEPGGLAFVDPVLGDNGLLDPTQTEAMVEAQRHLVSLANIIAPNLTEAAFLLDAPYDADLSIKEQKEWLKALADLGPKIVVITSAPASSSHYCAVLAYHKKQQTFYRLEHLRYPVFFPGTGDAFSSCLVGCFLQGDTIANAIARAAYFITKGIERTFEAQTEPVEGVLLESTLHLLRDDNTGWMTVKSF